MTRLKLTIEYDGTGLAGWQRQENGPSVQQALEEAIHAFSGETVTVTGAGRTDAGVHARGQVAHADVRKAMRPDQIMAAINHHLADQRIAVVAAEEAGPDFHARFDATARHYRYRIVNRRAPLTLDAGLAWHVRVPLDASAMHGAAQVLVGHHDFTTFRSVHCQAKSPEKTLDVLGVERSGEEILISARARSFLHHQVRSMAGTLKLVGEGKWTADDVAAALAARDRTALGLNAPPEGLYLMQVDYAGPAK